MSMINDALKKAQQTKPDVSISRLVLRPVEPREAGGPEHRAWLTWPTLLLATIGALFIILGLVFLRQLTSKSAAPDITAAAAAPTHSDVTAKSATPARTAKPITPALATPAKTKSSAPGDSSTNTPATAQSAEPPPLKLQAIFFSPTAPSAIISGKSVSPGDQIRKSSIVSIRPDSVVLVENGETNILKLGH
jgi:hypothetical protein